MKTLLFIAISSIVLLFTSCEDEMREGHGDTSGGGKDSPHGVVDSKNLPLNENNVIEGSDIQE